MTQGTTPTTNQTQGQPQGQQQKLKLLNAHVYTKELENINEEKLPYVVIETDKGKVSIGIGEKNFKKLNEII